MAFVISAKNIVTVELASPVGQLKVSPPGAQNLPPKLSFDASDWLDRTVRTSRGESGDSGPVLYGGGVAAAEGSGSSGLVWEPPFCRKWPGTGSLYADSPFVERLPSGDRRALKRFPAVLETFCDRFARKGSQTVWKVTPGGKHASTAFWCRVTVVSEGVDAGRCETEIAVPPSMATNPFSAECSTRMAECRREMPVFYDEGLSWKDIDELRSSWLPMDGGFRNVLPGTAAAYVVEEGGGWSATALKGDDAEPVGGIYPDPDSAKRAVEEELAQCGYVHE